MVLVAAGLDQDGQVLDSAEILDLESEEFHEASPLLTARHSFVMSALGGRVVVAGGKDVAGNGLSSVETYSPALDSWQEEEDLELDSDRAGAAAAALNYLYGGCH